MPKYISCNHQSNSIQSYIKNPTNAIMADILCTLPSNVSLNNGGAPAIINPPNIKNTQNCKLTDTISNIDGISSKDAQYPINQYLPIIQDVSDRDDGITL